MFSISVTEVINKYEYLPLFPSLPLVFLDTSKRPFLDTVNSQGCHKKNKNFESNTATLSIFQLSDSP